MHNFIWMLKTWIFISCRVMFGWWLMLKYENKQDLYGNSFRLIVA